MRLLNDVAAAVRQASGATPRPKISAYLIGEGYLTSSVDGKPHYSWPYRLHFAPGHRSGDFGFSEGDARNGQSTSLCARDALKIEWRGHLKIVGAEWLIPLLERAAGGEPVPPLAVLDAYRQAHGHEPPHEEWEVD